MLTQNSMGSQRQRSTQTAQSLRCLKKHLARPHRWGRRTRNQRLETASEGRQRDISNVKKERVLKRLGWKAFEFATSELKRARGRRSLCVEACDNASTDEVIESNRALSKTRLENCVKCCSHFPTANAVKAAYAHAVRDARLFLLP